MSLGWSIFVTVLTLASIVACCALLVWARTARVGEPAPHEALGNDFDGIDELNTPLPRWWLLMFAGSIVYALGYLVLYPGLGSFRGVLGWTSVGEHDAEVAAAKAQYAPLYAKYVAMALPAVAADPQANAIGQRIFANNCAQCHGSDAGGGVGYPNLTDDRWIWGGTPEDIEKTITDGRSPVMPPFAPAIGGEEGIPAVAAYVLSLSGRTVDPELAKVGEAKFKTICIACHGMDAKGNQALGAPDLTDHDWLYGGTEAAIGEGLRKGRMGKMPAHRDLLGPERVHLVAAYVYGLSHRGAARDDDSQHGESHHGED
jgi:cytochrome c oxidase cbb3-type subunit 3